MLEKHGQAIGGIKSQMKILRERIAEVERHADKLKFLITLVLVGNGTFFAMLMIGYLLK